MFDFDLQMRFMKSAMDAWTGYAAASTAAFEAWQREAQQVLTGKVASKPAAFDMTNANPFMWWMNAFSGAQPMKSPAADFGAGFFQFAPQFATPFANPFASTAQPSFAFPNFAATPWTSAWTDMLQSCCWSWPQASWALYQTPMTAMLMSAGMPYSVAEPTARANAASMDAADAARLSFNNMYSSFQTAGGHAFTPIAMWQKFMELATLPMMAHMSGGNVPGRLL